MLVIVGRRFLLYTAYGNFTIPLQTELYAAVVGGVLHGTDVIALALKDR